MSDEELKKLGRTLRSAQLSIEHNLARQTDNLKKDQIANSINHLQISLEKYLKSAVIHELDNVYYHIGAIVAAAK